MRNIQLTLHLDAGHGYLEVPKSVVKPLGPEICNAISIYSFQSERDLFLEHDCDAPLVLEAMKKDWNVKIVTHNHDIDAPCRKYKRVNC